MASIFRLVSDINSSKIQWAMKLRLIRAYRVPARGNPRITQSFDCVFHDKEGERVHATINRDHIDKFEQTLNEGRVYAVKNFVVTFNRNTFRTTSNRKMIIFINETKVVEVLDEEFPSMIYKFKPFSELSIVENLNDAEMFDVIGRVVSVNELKIRKCNGVDRKLMEIVLEDEQRNQLHCSLWEEYATQMHDYVAIAGPEPPVLILQFCRGKIFKDRVDVSTTFNASKLGINVECTEVNSFKDRFNSTPMSMSSVSLTSASTIEYELSNSNALIKTIQQLTQNGEVGSFWVLARIVSIETFGEWWYLSCRVCKRKLTKEENEFKCLHCNKSDKNGTPRYKVQVRVQDETDNTLFILWDQHCIGLIGKTVSQILEEQADGQNDSLLPEALTSLINQEVMCKVQVKPEQRKNYFGAYSVQKLVSDPILIRKMGSNGTEYTNDISKIHEDDNESTMECSPDVEYITPLKKSNEFEDFNLKRKLIDEFSSTGPETKKVAMIKKEKD